MRGFNWVFYVGVAGALLLVVVIFVMVLRRMRKTPETPSAAPLQPPSKDREYLDKLEEELKKR